MCLRVYTHLYACVCICTSVKCCGHFFFSKCSCLHVLSHYSFSFLFLSFVSECKARIGSQGFNGYLPRDGVSINLFSVRGVLCVSELGVRKSIRPCKVLSQIMMPETLCKTGPTLLWRFILFLSQETKKHGGVWKLKSLSILKTVNWKTPTDVWCLWLMLQAIHKCWRQTNERSYQIVWWIHNPSMESVLDEALLWTVVRSLPFIALSLINFTIALFSVRNFILMADGNSEIDLLAIWWSVLNTKYVIVIKNRNVHIVFIM